MFDMTRLLPLVVLVACSGENGAKIENPPPPQPSAAVATPSDSSGDRPVKRPARVRKKRPDCPSICRVELAGGAVPDEKVALELRGAAKCLGNIFNFTDVPDHPPWAFARFVARAAEKRPEFREECGHLEKQLKDDKLLLEGDLEFTIKHNEESGRWSSVNEYCICAAGRGELESFLVNMIGPL